jgi:hypothetical protein
MSGHPSSFRSAAAAASVQRVLPTPSLSVTSSNLPLPRFAEHQFLPPFVANSKLLCMMRVVDRCQRSTSFAEVGRHVKIEQAVAIVVDPDCAVAVDPAVQTAAFGHVLEVVAVDVFEEREIAVAIDEHVLASVVVEVTPYAAHRDAVARDD